MKINARLNGTTTNYTYDRFRNDFEIIDRLPKIGDELDGEKVVNIENLDLDSEQANDEPYSYEFWEVTVLRRDDDEEYEVAEIYATKIEEEEEEWA